MSTDTQSKPRLAYRSWGPEGAPQIWILHGILGSKQNWTRFSQHLSESQPHLQIKAFDLRCHGDSIGFLGPHSVRNCSEDLHYEAQQLGAPQVLIGHSFGGKVALAYGAKVGAAGNPLRALWTLDSPLDSAPRPGHGEVAQVIEVCAQIPMPQVSRKALSDALQAQGLSQGIAQWMTTNLRPTPEGFIWRFDLSGIQALMRDYWRLEAWHLLGVIPQETALRLLRAERGMRWDEDAAARLREVAPHAQSPLLKDSGHWVHIDQPNALIQLLSDDLTWLGLV